MSVKVVVVVVAAAACQVTFPKTLNGRWCCTRPPQGHWCRRTMVGGVCWICKLGISFDRVGINGFRTDGDDRLLIYQAILFQPFIFFHAWRNNRSWTLIVDDRKFRSFTKNRAICILSDYLCLHRDHYNQSLTVHPSSISSAYHIRQSNLIFGLLF